jgi:hypothetical protein
MAKGEWEKTTRLIDRAVGILEMENPMTIRQLFYRLVSAGALANSRADYQRLSVVMSKARNDNRCDFDWIVDRSRPEYSPAQLERAIRSLVRRPTSRDLPLVSVDTKDADSRSRGFRAEHGEDCVELDALPVPELRRRIQEAVEAKMDRAAWNRAVQVEAVELRNIQETVGKWIGQS